MELQNRTDYAAVTLSQLLSEKVIATRSAAEFLVYTKVAIGFEGLDIYLNSLLQLEAYVNLFFKILNKNNAQK